MKKTYIFILLLSLNLSGFAQSSNSETNEHYRLGKVYYENGLYSQAEEEFQKALQNTNSIANNVNKQPNDLKPEYTPTPNTDANDQSSIPLVPYVIDKGDTLKISVWENPDLSQELTVRPDGVVSMPLAGEIIAKGKTITQLDNEITMHLNTYIRHPDVSVSLKEMGGNKVVILGEVNRPGKYSLNDASTVIEAIAAAGGFGRDAVQNSIIVISGGLEHPAPRRVHVQKAIRGGMMGDNNIQLTAKDIVFVPRKFVADINYFMMKVLEPLTSGTSTESTIKNL
jgi:polysaccharide export outer membrane protein